MKYIIHLLAVVLWVTVLMPAGSANASLESAQVVTDPLDSSNKVVRLRVEKKDDLSWIHIPFDVVPGWEHHGALEVSFDIYRPYDTTQEWFYWSWTADGEDPIDPIYGGQHDDETLPFIGRVTTNTAPTVFDRWVTMEMVWEFFETPQHYASPEYTGDIHGYVHSYYAGSEIDMGYPLILQNDGHLTGYLFGLQSFHDESDLVYLDNFWIYGSDIYNSHGFDAFDLGDLNGQDGWTAGAYTRPIPIPSTLFLLGLGLLSVAGIRRNPKT